MADLTSSSVVSNFECEVGDRFSKTRQEVVKDVTMTLSGHGDGQSGSNIPAAALGFSKLYPSEGLLVSSDNSQLALQSPNYVGDSLLLIHAHTVGSAISLAPAQFTGTFIGRVRGQAL